MSAGWTPAQIREALVARGTTIYELATAHGLSKETLATASRGATRSPRHQRIVADALGVELHTLWPALYPPGPYQDGRHRDTSRFDRVLARVEAGESIRGVCSEPGMPTRRSVHKHAEKHPSPS